MQPARQDLPVIRGTSYRDTVRIMQPELVYRTISSIFGAPAVLEIPGHGLDSDWPIWVRGVRGLAEINREPSRQMPHRARRIDENQLELNGISATGFKPEGGQLLYLKPVDLSQAAPALTVWNGTSVALRLELGAGLEITALGTVSRAISPTESSLLEGCDLHYTFDVTYLGGVITRYFEGRIL